jgi:hypothetical protein
VPFKPERYLKPRAVSGKAGGVTIKSFSSIQSSNWHYRRSQQKSMHCSSTSMSGKLIRILRHFHHKLTTQIRLNGVLSSPIDITEVLAQGEVLSPLLFILYISDIEEVLQQFWVSGITIDSSCQLHILLYADDIVVLSNTRQGLQVKIRKLERYFDANRLTVNLKTKIGVFRRGDDCLKIRFSVTKTKTSRWYS